MADTYSTYLAIRLPATGAYNNTWGATLNSDAFQLLDTAIAGQSTVITLSGTTYSLPALTGGSASTTRNFCLVFAGSPGAGVTVTVPSSVPARMYLIQNSTGQMLTFTYSGSTSTATVSAGNYQLIWCDGSNCWNVAANAGNSPNLNGIPAANWARQSRTAAEIAAATVVLNEMTIPTSWTYVTATEAPTVTLDWNNGNSQILTLTGNRTMAAPVNKQDGAEIDLLVVQDASGSRTLTWNSVFIFENGLTPTLGTAAGSVDRFLLKYNAALNKWVVGHFGNINAGSGTTLPLVISSNVTNFKLSGLLGTLSGAVTVNLQVAAGVVVDASDPSAYAMDLSGLVSGSTVNLVNNGYVIGGGGAGADGGAVCYPGSGQTALSASVAESGGTALLGPGSGCAFNVTNANGHIWGGGGGGGGGGANVATAGADLANAGGGGGGAGGGRGGQGGRLQQQGTGSTALLGGNGGRGTRGISGTGGAAGAGAFSGANGGTGAAGAGGGYGAAGTAGADYSGGPYLVKGSASAAGTAGAAIYLAGGAVTWISGSGSPNVLGAVS